MKRMYRKGSTAIALAAATALFLTGCSSSNSPEPTNADKGSSDPAAATEAPAAANLKPYKLKFVYPGSKQPDSAKIEAAMNEILQKKINATVEIVPIDWGQWDNKVNLMIASREPFDVIFTAQWNGHAVNVSKGALLALNDDNLLKKHGQGIIDSLNPTFFEGAAINGKNYGVPTNKELAASGGVIYRSDIAEELGLDMSNVKTLRDLDPILKAVKEQKPEMIPLFVRNGDNLNTHYLQQYDTMGDASIPGVVLKDQTDTKVVSKLDTDRYKETVKLARDFMLKGYVNKDAASSTIYAQDAMKAGNVFMMAASLKPGKDTELANSIGLAGKLKQIEMTGPTVSTAEPAGSMLGISTTSKDPERSMMLINLLHTDKELNNLFNFGLEGEHYTKVSDNVIKATNNAKNYAPAFSWMIGNQFLNYLWDNEDPQKWDKFKVFNEAAKKSPALGFTFDAEPVKTEVAAVVNVQVEFDASLDTGSVDPDTVLPKYLEKLKASGIDKIIAEKQKQLDAFLATKK